MGFLLVARGVQQVNDRVDGIERHHANVSKENSKRLNAVDLRISGLQGSCGEHKRDINKQRDSWWPPRGFSCCFIRLQLKRGHTSEFLG